MVNGLNKSGLFSGFLGGSLAEFMPSNKDRNLGKSTLKIGALTTVDGVAWKA
jgi:hypothetical protein